MARLSKARQDIADFQADIQEYGLAEPVSKTQLRQLQQYGYIGPTPCSHKQAAHILRRYKKKGKGDAAI